MMNSDRGGKMFEISLLLLCFKNLPLPLSVTLLSAHVGFLQLANRGTYMLVRRLT